MYEHKLSFEEYIDLTENSDILSPYIEEWVSGGIIEGYDLGEFDNDGHKYKYMFKLYLNEFQYTKFRLMV